MCVTAVRPGRALSHSTSGAGGCRRQGSPTFNHVRGVVSTPRYIAPPYRGSNGDSVAETASQSQRRTLGNRFSCLISLPKNFPKKKKKKNRSLYTIPIFTHSFHQQTHARTSFTHLTWQIANKTWTSFFLFFFFLVFSRSFNRKIVSEKKKKKKKKKKNIDVKEDTNDEHSFTTSFFLSLPYFVHDKPFFFSSRGLANRISVRFDGFGWWPGSRSKIESKNAAEPSESSGRPGPEPNRIFDSVWLVWPHADRKTCLKSGRSFVRYSTVFLS